MNARNSLIYWIIGIIIFAGVIVGFAHGAQLTDTDGLRGGIWMVGSAGVLCLEVYAAIKLNTRK